MRDEGFYDQYVRPYEERMMACAWNIVREREGARDALQDALATVWRKRETVAAHPNPEALLLRICRESAIDQVRQVARRGLRETAVEELPEAEGATRETPLTRLCDAELAAGIRKAVAALPGNQSLAVIMRIVEGLPYEEVAATLGCSEATARVHVKRGREKLREGLTLLGVACP